MVGVRLGLGAILRPVVFAHAGVGHGTFSSPTGTDLDRTGLAYDAGGGIDFTLLPLLNVGVYGAYNFLASKSGADALKWASLGLNAELVF